jgi:serine/threonine-protein kinase
VRYTQRELLTAFATVCLTIDYAHSRGVIHRDLKPANIMLGDFGEVYVLDWGLARLIDGSERAASESGERLSMTGELLGTPLYMAPEQMVDPDVDVRADVFALGAILFELLTFERLRDAKTLYLPADARASARAPERGVAPELETICVRATESAAADRYPSARALHAEIVKFLEGDRELEQRRQLAAVHAGRARDALARAEEAGRDPDHERGVAVRELRDAVALDPADEHVGALGTLLTTPPRTIPPEVHAEMRNETERVIHRGAVFSVIGMASWFIFFPVMYVIGIRDYLQVALIAVPALISIAASIVAVRQRVISRSIQYVTVGFMLLGAMATSRVLGPLVLMPTLIVSYAIVLQAHPARRFRRIGLVGGIVALTVPFALELVGVIPSSYGFLDGNMLIRPQLMVLPGVWTEVFLAVTNLTMIVVPCVFISRLRAELSDAQTRQLVQAWQFKRLGGEPVVAPV